MTWQRVASGGGGSVAGLAARRSEVFAATASGVFRSSDAGRTWTLPGSARGVAFAEAVAVTADSVLACAADGLYRSRDGGASWQRVLEGARMLSLATTSSGVATSSSGVATSSSGLALAGSELDGVFRSSDGGASWIGANAGLLDLSVLCLAVSPNFATDGTAFVGTPSGLYRSRNAAESWRTVDLRGLEPALQCLAVSPQFADDRMVIAGTEVDGLLISTDGGSTWRAELSGSVNAVVFAPNGALVAATDTGIYASADRGATWQQASESPGAVLCLAYAENHLLAGLLHDGIARSPDAGATWAASNDGLEAETPTAISVVDSRTILVASLDRGLRRSVDGGRTWQACQLREPRAANAGVAIVGLATSQRAVHSATTAGLFVSRDNGATWQPAGPTAGTLETSVPVSDPQRPMAEPPRSNDGASEARATETPEPVRAIAAEGCFVVAAFGDSSISTSDDCGATWQPLAVPFGGQVVSLSVTEQQVFVGVSDSTSNERALWRHDSHAWQRWLVAPGAGGMPIAASEGQVIAAIGNQVLTPMRGAQEVHAGERRPMWRRANLRADVVAVSSLAAAGRTALAATNAGVCLSRDAGQTFEPWSDGLDPPGVVAVALSPTDEAYALGIGGTLWRRAMVTTAGSR